MRARAGLLVAALAWGPLGCFGYSATHAIQWDARGQIHAAEASQVRVRNAQSRSYERTDKIDMLEAIVATFQDLDFQVEVLDPVLGIVSGKKFRARQTSDTTYFTYEPEALVVFSKSYRTWGPFHHRSDLVRLTVTVREGGGERLIVRAAAQHYLEPIEDPTRYQGFFSTLEKSLFVARETASR